MSRTPSSTASGVLKSAPSTVPAGLVKASASASGFSVGSANSLSAKGSMPASRAIMPLVRRLGL